MVGKINFEDFRDNLLAQLAKYSISDMAVLNFNSSRYQKNIQRIRSLYQSETITKWPKYIRETAALRAEPQQTFPWSKSLVFLAIPFRSIPKKEPFLPQANVKHWGGKIAGYAARIDYHNYAREVLAKLAEAIDDLYGEPMRYEICVDTKPLPEKHLAAMASLQSLGRNTCLLCNNEGSGCFIATLITDTILPMSTETEVKNYCISCDHCRNVCPNNVLEDTPGMFDCDNCISYLSMEKGRELRPLEQQMLNGWVFGCDLCTGACPESKLPPRIAVDLKWVLESDTNAVQNAIENTPISYIGPTILRRNALYVLAQKKNRDIKPVIQAFAQKTGSDLLKSVCQQIL